MGLRAWNVGVLVAVGALWFASGTQREKPVLAEGHGDAVRALEADLAAHPTDSARLRGLAQGYLDARAPGLALSVIEAAPVEVRNEPAVDHLYARALLEQGRSADALAVERRVLDRCAGEPSAACSSWLIASATRRVDILQELVQLGVEDAQAHPEASALAYHNATRQVGLATR